NVTLHCAALQKGICNVYWYKQSLGFVPQTVASKVNDSVTVYPRFNSSFTVDKGFLAFNLKIRSITKDDEAIYFCQEGLSDSWSGTFVSVKGTKNLNISNQPFVSQTVVQQPVSASAQLGDPVALQCSITSQRTDHSNQCQGEPSVYWFRSGPSHPAAIYMNGNRSGECQNSSGRPSAPQSCVYTLPKNNVDSSDAGTYYCALAACGEVVFGNGTKSGPSHPAAIYMNGNRSGECQNSSGPPSAPQSCVYTLPKNNVDASDAGTYHCALAACGEVVFGSGTKLDIKGHYIVLLISRILVVFIILTEDRQSTGKTRCQRRKAGSITGTETEQAGRGQAGSITGNQSRNRWRRSITNNQPY
uniref:Ig-like domain-containing protein n=1 Tax=Gadus morhua TaxID=8049 RepID=A0A8C5FA65_GADMO